MKPKPKSTRDAAPETAAGALANFFYDGVARFAEAQKSALEKLVDAQKSLLDLSVEQSAQVMSAAKERADAASQFAATLAEMARQSAGRAVAAQKLVLDYAAGQNATVAHSFQHQFGLAETHPVAVAAESLRRGVDIVFEAQKQLLDLASKPFQAARSGGD